MAPRAPKSPDSARNAPKSRPSSAKSAGSPARKAPAKKPAAAKATAAPAPSPKPVVPEALGPAGLKIWSAVVAEYDLRPDELRILEDACREATLIDRLHHELQGAPLLVKGSMGQQVASPLVQEVRQHRATFAQLMARLKLEDLDGSTGAGERAARARSAAQARWRRGA